MDPDRLERLRQDSRLFLDRDGRLFHEGVPVEHPRVLQAFHRGFARAPDGRPTVHFGGTWAYLQVEDTLYRVNELEAVAREGRLERLVASLDDETTEDVPLEPGRIALSADEVLSIRVKGGTEWARCAPGAHALLGQFLVEQDGAFILPTALGPLAVGRR